MAQMGHLPHPCLSSPPPSPEAPKAMCESSSEARPRPSTTRSKVHALPASSSTLSPILPCAPLTCGQNDAPFSFRPSPSPGTGSPLSCADSRSTTLVRHWLYFSCSVKIGMLSAVRESSSPSPTAYAGEGEASGQEVSSTGCATEKGARGRKGESKLSMRR